MERRNKETEQSKNALKGLYISGKQIEWRGGEGEAEEGVPPACLWLNAKRCLERAIYRLIPTDYLLSRNARLKYLAKGRE